MSGVHGQILRHVVKRGVEAAQSYQNAQLRHDAELYEKAGPDMEVKPWEILPVMITAMLAFLLMASVKYTLGEVMASLAMIESPTNTAIIEDKPPAYAGEPDAPLEKEPLMPSEAEADVEVTLIPNKPITAKITTTIRHVTSIGGFFARWRGIRYSILYHFLHGFVSNSLSSLLGLGLIGYALTYVFVSLALARVHMVWTHSMIAYPDSKSIFGRMVPRNRCKALLLPNLAVSVAEQLTILVPIMVAISLGLPEIDNHHVMNAASKHDCHKLAFMGLRFLAVPASGIFVAFCLLLPATVTLTRIEALLLPEGQDTIVPFDRQAIVGNVDVTGRGGSKAIFLQAWRSFDRAARWRLIKLYVKMIMIQISIVFVSIHLIVAEIYLIGGERLTVLFKSAMAQMKLAAIEA